MAVNLTHGFASMNGGTSGGSGGPSVTVSTGAQLQAAINGASGPLTIYVDGTITAANTGADVIAIAGHSNLSLVGVGTNADFSGIGIRVSDGASNLIIQNLKIHNVSGGPGDAIGIEGGAHNIWVDHNELSSSLAVDKDYYDGLLDIKRGADYVTVSNNYLHDHHKASLVGYSDEDVGDRHVTYDHNVFENVGSRTPSVRYGEAHIYDNYFKDVSVSGINLRDGAVGLIENNVFDHVRDPIASLDGAKVGSWTLHGNVLNDVTWSSPGGNEATAESGASTASYAVPYAYTLDGTASVAAYDLAHAGVGHLGLDPVAPSAPTQPTEPTQPSAPSSPTPPVTDPGSGASDPTPPATSTGMDGTSKADSLVGTAGDDSIDGLQGYDHIQGSAGNDAIAGGDGRDLLSGDAGNDTLSGGNGNDHLVGGAGNDMLDGGNGSDLIEGGDGNDVLRGGASHDVLVGGAGNDVLDGGGNADEMAGGTGDDTYIVDIARDTVVELTGEGTDTVLSATDYKLGDNLENLVLTGTGNTSATGNALDNVIFGNAGDNRIEGGAGDDVLSGGGGRNTYVFTKGEGGHDVIHDFQIGADTLDFHGYKAAEATLTDAAAGVTVHLPDETILLEGVHVKAITADWAHFA